MHTLQERIKYCVFDFRILNVFENACVEGSGWVGWDKTPLSYVSLHPSSQSMKCQKMCAPNLLAQVQLELTSVAI